MFRTPYPIFNDLKINEEGIVEINGKIVKQFITKDGKKGIRHPKFNKPLEIDRLLMLAFKNINHKGERYSNSGNLIVKHKNKNIEDNSLRNLEWEKGKWDNVTCDECEGSAFFLKINYNRITGDVVLKRKCIRCNSIFEHIFEY